MMLDDYISPLMVFCLAAGLFTITPGLDTVMVLKTAISSGRRGGAGAVLGISVGLSVWGMSAVLGLTALLAASKMAFTIVKYTGALYLTWMGVTMLLKPRSCLAQSNDEGVPPISDQQGVFWTSFRKGILTNLLNPKTGIFVMTFFPQFIPQNVNVEIFTCVQAVIQVVLSLIWTSILVLMTLPLERFFNRPHIMRRVDRITGGLFIMFGIKLFMTRAPS